MRIPAFLPAFLIEHPIEAVIAGALLLALVFGSSDHHAAETAQPAQVAQAARM
jgi:hypothetical protein